MGGRTPVRTAESGDKRVGWGSTHRRPQSSGPGGLGFAAPAPGSAGSGPPGRRGRCCPPALAWPPRARPGWSCPGDPGSAGPARSGCSHTRPVSQGRPSRRWGDLGGTARTCPQSRRGVGTGRKPSPAPPQAPPHPAGTQARRGQGRGSCKAGALRPRTSTSSEAPRTLCSRRIVGGVALRTGAAGNFSLCCE